MTIKSIVYDWGGLNVGLFEFVNQSHTDFWERPAYFGNLAGNYWGLPALVAVLLLFAYISNRQRKFAVASQLYLQTRRLVVGFAFACFGVAMLKTGFNFPRPLAALGSHVHMIGTPADHYSLPSGHTAYATLVVMVVWPLLSKFFRPLLLVFVAWVGWSRIASGAHFPADVVAGILVGAISGWMAYWAVQPLPSQGQPLPWRVAFHRMLVQARLSYAAGDTQRAFALLQEAHVRGQYLLWPHLLAHFWMLRIACSRRDWPEIPWQIWHIALAPIENVTGRLPTCEDQCVQADAAAPASILFKGKERYDR